MYLKIVIFFVMLAILISLASGLIFLIKDDGNTKRTVKALTFRIALSLGLFIFLILAFSLDWITPHAL